MNNKTLRHIAVYGISLPTFAVSPSVAKATIYMPSQVAARVFGGRPSTPADPYREPRAQDVPVEAPHAA